MNETILVIDDDATFNAVLVRALDRRGLTARGATDADEALALAEELRPDRIVLDLNLAGTSGLNLIPRLLAILPDARIVVLTGYASIATAVDAVKLGAVQYLAKPVEVDAILAGFAEGEAAEHEFAVPDEPLSVDRLEWEHIQRVLRENDGNISATARALKMHRRTLQRKLFKRPAKA
ncbi:MAG TPA: response regulator [Rhodocyclaceae bacterium]|nr:response regulator [Rhodocyclaceae bacterium]